MLTLLHKISISVIVIYNFLIIGNLEFKYYYIHIFCLVLHTAGASIFKYIQMISSNIKKETMEYVQYL